ncbi:MAG: ribosomal protein S18-alanine N-acetyltransferase [Dehalococcoidales bacterium]|nr:ribosomal protein S18-alanine N-acetyltransferase [Dehalococcoidales bacterium]
MAQQIGNGGELILAYSIRRMEKEDIGQVTEIDREAFPSQWPPANYRREMQNKTAHYIVLCDNNKTIDVPPATPPKRSINILSLMMPWTKQKAPEKIPLPHVTRQYIVGFSGIWMIADEAHLTNIAVREQYRGKGLGELLVIATIDLALKFEASFMTLEVRASNLAAQSLYQKYGFTQMGVRRGYYLDNREDAIIMSTESIGSEPFQRQVSELREALKKKLPDVKST